MYRPNDARFGFARWWYWCGSRLWRGRIKIVSVGAQAGLVISRLVRFFFLEVINWTNELKGETMTTQLCPYCGKPLEEGIFRSRGGNYYLPKDESAPFLYSKQAMIKKGAIQLLPDFVSSAPQWPLAYVCRNCKKIILPYEQ